ncbi:MAG: hypothetical protein RMM29_05640 [Planctomycetota bacterium]|nr:hypothetical protein [Planctomycetota bacterium]MCX8039594.1 hypothetical protein [Planctomycetota bacterium]MDW8373115.1 hypothetical protein [Planctomycetota bacterium]
MRAIIGRYRACFIGTDFFISRRTPSAPGESARRRSHDEIAAITERESASNADSSMTLDGRQHR